MLLRARNMSCCLPLTMRILIAALSIQLACVFAAAAPPATGGGGGGGGMPDAAAAMNAYRVVHQWVSEFSTPALENKASAIDPAGSRAICIILRRSGRVVGTGTDSSADGLMVRRAVGRALGEVLADPAGAKIPDDLKSTVGRSILIEFEAAGAMQPLVGQTFSDVSSQVEPGLEGIAMRRGETWAVRFPSQLRAAGKAGEIEQIFPSLAVELGLPAESLAELNRADNIGVYRFRTIHLAQSRPQEQPRQMYRGDVLVTESQVTQKSIALLADGIAMHLLESRWPDPVALPTGPAPNAREPLGVMGTYRPVADEYEGPIAKPLDQALAAWALLEFSVAPGVNAGIASAAAAGAAEILRDLASVRPVESDPLAEPDTCAAIILAIAAIPDSAAGQAAADPSIAGLRDSAARRVVVVEAVAARAPGLAPAPGPASGREADANAAGPGPHSLALRAAAMAKLLRRWPGKTDAAAVRAAIDQAWAAAAPQQRVALLPFIGWAEMDYADATGSPIANAAILSELGQLLNASQITAQTENAADDLRGGFALRTAGSDGRVQATSQSARPICWLATALGEPRLTDPDQSMAALARLLRAMRFLEQISLRQELTWTVRNPQRALGGLRNAPWDSDMPVPAQALGLVAASQTLVSLDQLGKRAGNP